MSIKKYCIQCGSEKSLEGPFPGILLNNLSYSNNRYECDTIKIIFFICDSCLKKEIVYKFLGILIGVGLSAIFGLIMFFQSFFNENIPFIFFLLWSIIFIKMIK